MPDPIKFPTLFTPEDTERMRVLEEQRRELERAYQVKFSTEAWGATPPLERGLRRITPPWFRPGVNLLTPGVEPSTEFGFTPEQFQEESAAVEKEFVELTRRKRVTELLPSIQSDLVVAALAGKPITETTELLSTFPELRSDFNEGEINYLARMSQALLQATPEQLLSGEFFASEPNQLPITQEDMDSLFLKGKQDPTKIFATVEFTKSLEGMTKALKDAYPSKTSDGDAAKAMRDKLRLYFQQRNKELGITAEVPTNQSIAEYHKKVAEKMGTSLTLVDEKGNLVPATLKGDNTVWVNNEFIGAYDAASKKIVPISPRTGLPLPTQADQESDAKNLWDSFYLNLVEAGHLSKQGILDILLSAYSLPALEAPSRKAINAEIRDHIKQRYDANIVEHQEWLKDHPELAPKPEFEQSPSEHPELFKDPNYIPYLILSNAPMMVLGAVVGLGAALVTKNPMVGAVAGAAALTPMQITSVHQDLIDNGASPELATELAVPIGTVIGAVEIAPELIFLRAVTPGFMKLFRRNLSRELAKGVVTSLGVKGLLRTAGRIEIAETLEEISQQVIQNATVKTVNDARAILEGIKDTAIQTLIAVFPMAAFGGGAEYINMKSNLPPKVQGKIDETASEMEGVGLGKDHAQAVALSKVMENPIVEIQVNSAAEKVQEESTKPANIIKMEEQIADYNQEITELDLKIKNQLDKATRVTEPKGREIEMGFVDALNETLSEVEDEKVALIKRLEKARARIGQPPVVAAVPEAVGEVSELVPGSVIIPTKTNLTVGIGTYDTVKNMDYHINNIKMEIERGKKTPSGTLENRMLSAREQDLEQLETRRAELIKAQSELPVPSLASVVAKIIAGERLSMEETQFYNKNTAAVEDALQAQVTAPEEGVEESPVDREVREAIAKKPLPAPGELEYFMTHVAEAARRAMLRIPSLIASPTQALPRLMDFELEVSLMEKAIQDNPELLNVNKVLVSLREEASQTLKGLAELTESLGDMDEEELIKKLKKGAKEEGAVKELLDQYKKISKGTGIRWKELVGKSLGDLPPSDQRKVVASFLPDRSIEYQKIDWNVKDTSLVMSDFQRETGMPFSVFYQRTELIRGYVDRLADRYLQDITKNPLFKGIVGNEKGEERVRLELNARDPDSGIQHPENLTREEGMMASAIEAVYKEWEPIVRFLRFTEAYEDTQTAETIKKSYIKDAPVEDLQAAIEILEAQGEDALWHFLGGKDWGVIKSGYDPRNIHKMKLDFSKPEVSATRGAGYLMSREESAFSGSDRSLLHTFDSYNKGMAIRWFIRGEIKTAVEMLRATEDKWKNSQMVNDYVKGYLKEVQGFPPENNPYVSALRKGRNIVYPIVFAYHWLAARNVVQPLYSFPFRTSLITSLVHFKTLPISFRGKADIFFSVVIDQSGRPIREFLVLSGSSSGSLRGWQETVFKPLGLATHALEKLAKIQGKLSLMAFTDRVSRKWAFNAALDRAFGATERYVKDKNLEKWFKSSGVSIAYFTPEQQAIILGYLKAGDKDFSWAIPGLQKVTGYEAANILIAKEITDRTLFMYNAASGGKMHWGSGKIFGSLVVYPRSSVQMVSMQIGKLFSEQSTAEERVTATRHLLMILLAGELLSNALSGISGKDKKEYSLLNMFAWNLGGLTFGAAQEMSEFINSLFTAGLGSEEDKNRVLATLPTTLTRLGDIGIGFYRIAMDALETITDEPSGLDKRWIRKLRAYLDNNYKPAEVEKAERTALEKFQKIFMGTEQQPPELIEIALKEVAEAELKLGTIGVTGDFFTLGDLGNVIEKATKEVPPYMLNEEDGYSDLALFYLKSRQDWEELYKLPGDTGDARLRGLSPRDKWRIAHPEVEAELLFWEKFNKSRFTRGSKESKEVASLLDTWFNLYGIDRTKHRFFTSWSLPVTIPLPGS